MKKNSILLSLLFMTLSTFVVMAQPKIVDDQGVSITYVLNGGVNSPNNLDSYSPDNDIILEEPQKEGYIFGGWYGEADFSGNRIKKIEKGSLKPQKFYAKWVNKKLINIDVDMIDIVPSGKKVVLENFARTSGVSEIKGYKISKFEVTQELYEAVMGVNPSWYTNNSKETKISKGENQNRRPVEAITWYDAIYFCNCLTTLILGESECCYKISNIEREYDKTYTSVGYIVSCDVEFDFTKKGYRLPTEEEWEFAARGGTSDEWNKIYSGSNKINDVAWSRENSNVTHEVGKKRPNALGLYDMTGNVAELYNPVFAPRYRDDEPLFLGGSFFDYMKACEITYRKRYISMSGSSYGPAFLDADVGFRLAQTN